MLVLLRLCLEICHVVLDVNESFMAAEHFRYQIAIESAFAYIKSATTESAGSFCSATATIVDAEDNSSSALNYTTSTKQLEYYHQPQQPINQQAGHPTSENKSDFINDDRNFFSSLGSPKTPDNGKNTNKIFNFAQSRICDLCNNGFNALGLLPKLFRQQDVLLSQLMTMEELQLMMIHFYVSLKGKAECLFHDVKIVSRCVNLIITLVKHILNEKQWLWVSQPFRPDTEIPHMPSVVVRCIRLYNNLTGSASNSSSQIQQQTNNNQTPSIVSATTSSPQSISYNSQRTETSALIESPPPSLHSSAILLTDSLSSSSSIPQDSTTVSSSFSTASVSKKSESFVQSLSSLVDNDIRTVSNKLQKLSDSNQRDTAEGTQIEAAAAAADDDTQVAAGTLVNACGKLKSIVQIKETQIVTNGSRKAENLKQLFLPPKERLENRLSSNEDLDATSPSISWISFAEAKGKRYPLFGEEKTAAAGEAAAAAMVEKSNSQQHTTIYHPLLSLSSTSSQGIANLWSMKTEKASQSLISNIMNDPSGLLPVDFLSFQACCRLFQSMVLDSGCFEKLLVSDNRFK